MAEGSTLRPATDAQTLSSDGGSSRAGSPEDQYFDESYYNELVAGADERDEKDRETLVVPRVRDVWDMDFSNEDEATTTFHMFNELPLNHPTSTTSHWDASIPQLYPDIGGALVDGPWSDYVTDLDSEQEMTENEICSPQHAARPPLSGLTNLDFSWLPQDFGILTTPLAPAIYQQNANDENQPLQLQQFRVRDAPHAFTRLPQPQHVTAFAAAHSTDATVTQGAGSLPINLEDGENGEIDAGVHSKTNGDKSDDDTLYRPNLSSRAETSTTYSEATTPYLSEPQDSAASSPPSEVAETQAGPTESSSLENSQEAEIPAGGATDAQSTPSEEPSAPTAAAEEPVCSDKKNSSRKRRLSEAEYQPTKRPASESKVASNAVDNDTLRVLYAAPPSPAPLPVAGAPADAPAVESEPPSGATDEETGPEEASETVTTNATPAVASDVVSPTTAASPAPQHIPLGPSGHYASADAHLQGIFDAPLPDSELPAPTPLSHAANDGGYQEGSHGATSGPPSDASGAVIATPAPPLAQPVPVNATHGLANTVVLGNAPIAPSSLPAPPVSTSGSGAPAPRRKNQKQPKEKQGTSTGKKGGRGARSKNNNKTPADQPWLQGTIFSSRGSAQPPVPQAANAGPSNGPTSNGTHEEQKLLNPYMLFLQDQKQCGRKKTWAALTDAQKLHYEQMYDDSVVKQSLERQARRNAQSTPASSSG